jgi:hypothetical protein
MKLKNSAKKQEKKWKFPFLFNDGRLHKDSCFGKYVVKNVPRQQPNLSAGLPVKGE